MPMVEIGVRKKFRGLSTEEKPTTGLDVGDIWVECDTARQYIWDGSKWVELHPVEAASYIIFQEGDYVKAKNGLTGQIEFSGTDAADVIQNAIDALPTGGLIFIRRGTYSLSKGLTINAHGIILRGEGPDITTLDFSQAGSGAMITIGDGVARKDRIEVSFMTLRGRNDAAVPQKAIYVNYAAYLLFYRLVIHYFAGSGMYAIHGTKMAHSTIMDCHFWNNNGAVLIDGTTDNTANKIAFNYFYATGANPNPQLYIKAGSALNRIIGNLFEGGLERIRVEANNNVIMGNSFEYNEGAVDLVISGSGHLVIGNNFTNGVNNTTTNSLFARNIVYSTPKCGTATMPAGATSVTVNHGMPATPTIIVVTPRGNLGSVWVSARDSTSFTINCSSAPTVDTIVDWYAEV